MTKKLSRPAQCADLVHPDRYKKIEHAVSYDEHIRAANFGRWLSHWMEIQALKRALAGLEGKVVLDGPCGTGRIHENLLTKFPVIVSLDSSESMLHVHQDKIHSTRLCCGDIFHLPFKDNEFDWVVCHRLFHHMQNRTDRVKLLKSLARVSQHGVVFTAWIDTLLNKRRGSRRRSLSRKEVDSVIAEANISVIDIHYVSWPFQPKCVVTCKKLNR